MIIQLFGSASRLKILKLFFLNPETSFTEKELIARTGVRHVLKELDILEKTGIIKSVILKGNNKSWSLDREFSLFEEVRSLIIKSQFLYEGELVKKVNKTGKVKILLLSGFFSGVPDAEVDMLLVGRFNRDKVKKCIKAFEKEMGREINYVILTEAEYNYRRDITDVFLYNILDGKKIIAIGDVKNL